MLGLWKVRRGRKAAVALIAPFVEESRWRLPAIPEEAWFDPYMVGFMATLISLAADKATGGLDSQQAGLVQIAAWQDITGCSTDLIGEEICLLSAANDRMFSEGCRNAARFMTGLARMQSAHPDLTAPGHQHHGFGYNVEAATAAWAESFDTHLSIFEVRPPLV